jgi:hypothetical protein
MKRWIVILWVILMLGVVVTVVSALQFNTPIEIQCISQSHTTANGTREVLTFLSQRVKPNGEVVCRYQYERQRWILGQ